MAPRAINHLDRVAIEPQMVVRDGTVPQQRLAFIEQATLPLRHPRWPARARRSPPQRELHADHARQRDRVGEAPPSFVVLAELPEDASLELHVLGFEPSRAQPLREAQAGPEARRGALPLSHLEEHEHLQAEAQHLGAC